MANNDNDNDNDNNNNKNYPIPQEIYGKKRSENKKWIKHKTSWGHIRSFFDKTKRKKKENKRKKERIFYFMIYACMQVLSFSFYSFLIIEYNVINQFNIRNRMSG